MKNSFFTRQECDSTLLPFIGNYCPNLVKLKIKMPSKELVENDIVNLLLSLNKLKCINIEFRNIKIMKSQAAVPILDNLPVGIEEIVISMCKYDRNPRYQLDKLLSVSFLFLIFYIFTKKKNEQL